MRPRPAERTHTDFFQTIRSFRDRRVPIRLFHVSCRVYREHVLKISAEAISEAMQKACTIPLEKDSMVASTKTLCKQMLDAKEDVRISCVLKALKLKNDYPIQTQLCLLMAREEIDHFLKSEKKEESTPRITLPELKKKIDFIIAYFNTTPPLVKLAYEESKVVKKMVLASHLDFYYSTAARLCNSLKVGIVSPKDSEIATYAIYVAKETAILLSSKLKENISASQKSAPKQSQSPAC